MKTSFYFVLWILIYPILGLINNSFIDNNSFIVALAIVWGLSWLLNRLMPETLTYERVLHVAPIYEDVYSGNVQSFRKRLSREATIKTITAVYFIVSTIVIGIAVFKLGINDWIALAIFAFFSYGAIVRSGYLLKASSSLRSNPTPERCMEIADETYKLDYASYYEARQSAEYEEMFPPKPKCFKAFQIFSIIIASVVAILGLIYILMAAIIAFGNDSIEADALAGMYFLYSSLATYFGVKDFISCIQTLKHKQK